MKETVGEKIAVHRKRLGMTQEELGGKLGVSGQAVSKWELAVLHPDAALTKKAPPELYGSGDAVSLSFR